MSSGNDAEDKNSGRVVPVDADVDEDGFKVLTSEKRPNLKWWQNLLKFRSERVEKHKYWSTKAEVEKTVPFGMIHPSNPFLRSWSMFIILCLAWVGIILPVDLCFDLTGRSSAGQDFKNIEEMIDYAFWIDLVSYFFVGYRKFHRKQKTYEIEFRRELVAYNYFTTWFAVDFLACLSSLTSDISYFAKLARAPRMVRLLRVVRLLRLFKLFHLRRNLASTFAKRNSTLMQLLRTVAIFYIAAHWCGSIWYLIATFSWQDCWDQYASHPNATELVYTCWEERCLDPDEDSWLKQADLCNERSDGKMYMVSVYVRVRAVAMCDLQYMIHDM
jgi:hypothetical protein